MPVTLRQLTEERARIEVPVMDDKVIIYYAPGKLTPEYSKLARQRMAAEMARGDEGEYEMEVVNTFLDLVVEWDLLIDEGKPVVELTEEALFAHVPIPFINVCVELIMGDITPGEAKSGNSVVGYRQAARSANPRTTTRSSGQQGTSGVRRGSFSKNR